MANMNADVDAVDALRNIYVMVTVRRRNEARLRSRLGFWLLALAVQVLNCNIDVLTEREDA